MIIGKNIRKTCIIELYLLNLQRLIYQYLKLTIKESL